jgi:hypothetical protein
MGMPVRVSRFLRSLLGLAVTTLMTTTALVAVPAAARADVSVRSDPRGDVVQVDEEGLPTAAPSRTNGDIKRTVFRHKAHRIRVRIGFAELSRTFNGLFVTAFIRTNTGWLQEATVIVNRDENDPWSGWAVLGDDENDLNCAIHHRIDYAHNVIIIGFPRKCLHNPRWVRIGADSRIYPTPKVYPEYLDHALRGAITNTENYVPPLSRRLFR